MTTDVLLPLQAPSEEHGPPADGSDSKRTPASRLLALDIVRGFTVAVMILVDDAGDAYQQIDHAPWDGYTMADLVMPWFLFMVGNAMAFSLKNKLDAGGRRAALTKLLIRTAKLFLLGVVLQSGGFPRHTWQTWGFDLSRIRFCGILQRIAFAYFIVGLTALYVPVREMTGTPLKSLLCAYATQSLVPALFTIVYLVLMLATPVPDWTVANTSTSRDHGIVGKTIACGGVRGDLGPACNAAGFYDRLLFGQAHLFQPGEKVRLPECSTCSPGKCWSPANHSQLPPVYCWAPFDPEGALSSFLAVVTAYIGLHFGRAVHIARRQAEPPRALLRMWGATVASCALVSLALLPAFPLNKQLWTPSYTLLNSAMTGGALIIVYLLCDVLQLRAAVYALRPFQWMGLNALFVFVFGASDVFDLIVDSVFVGNPRHTLTWLIQSKFDGAFRGNSRWDDHAVATLLYVLCKIAFWMAVCGVLHRNRWYWKF